MKRLNRIRSSSSFSRHPDVHPQPLSFYFERHPPQLIFNLAYEPFLARNGAFLWCAICSALPAVATTFFQPVEALNQGKNGLQSVYEPAHDRLGNWSDRCDCLQTLWLKRTVAPLSKGFHHAHALLQQSTASEGNVNFNWSTCH